MVACLLALPLAAQVRESVTVEVIDVPVYVFNGDGPVRNLSKDDFELYVNGTKRTIDYFDTIDFSPATQTQTATVSNAERDPRERRLFLLLFDLVFARPIGVDRARSAAAKMIDAAAPTDFFAVAVFTRTAGIKLITPFTNDHERARSAALHLADPSERDPLAIAMPKNERGNEVAIPGSTAAKHSRDEAFRDETVLSMYAFDSLHDNIARPVTHLIADQAAELDRIATRMGQLEGYKHVVLFSDGIPPQFVYTTMYTNDEELFSRMNAMFNAFRRANVVVDTIDTGDNWQRNTSSSDALRMMSAETGGQFIGSRNDYQGALTRISTVSQAGYRLGFAKPADAKPADAAAEAPKDDAAKPVVKRVRKAATKTPGTAKTDGAKDGE